ncbi:M23 family metallopeptidase [Chryseobacterium turcicum]|uniref:M23 family metallopeptidase n=1 Tax=Chryseobacterium turcicum TaxID=2898076 RepID=A0A9Q3V6X7_9FLAO|nr:M23 family metallopeptidase [Chryseobacterium turcicum]MCD1118414.1 M23 family metallopeptidase [Chryseobacterium turcicum]
MAIADGKVIGKNKYFGANDVYVSILHNLPDGRKFIAKYCELAKSSVSLEVGNQVRQKQELGKTAHLGVSAYNRKVKKTYSLYMCHFEIYDCSAGEDNPIYMGNNPPYMRRKDLIDPLSILEEGYRNTFGEIGDGNDHLFTINDGKEALRELYNEYKNSTWNWKWNGSDTEVQVTGKDLLTIVEKMYRLETTHFTSKQYKHCGTGGMEVFGSAPHYGWDGSLYTEEPIGTWSSFENAGLSGQGGNAQVTNKQKEFVQLPSVISGMRYKINYIIKYNGNFERWFSKTDETARSTYRTTLRGIRDRFIQEISGN